MPSGLTYFLTRLGGSLITMLVGTMVVFFVMKAAPGDPALVVLGDFATPETIARFNADRGLDAPWLMQYADWLGGILRFDFGTSLSVSADQDISSLLAFRLPKTIFIGLYAMAIAIILSLILGTLAARNRGNMVDTGATSLAVLGVSIGLGLFPSYGFTPPSESILGALHSGFLPALAIAAPMAAVFTRTLRTSLIENLDREHVTVARSLGHSSRFQFLHHVFRNSAIPYIVVIGLQIRYLLGGVVIIERIFGVNGVGSLMVEAAFARDYFVVQACAVVFLAIVLGVNYVVDMICAMLDPRRTR